MHCNSESERCCRWLLEITVKDWRRHIPSTSSLHPVCCLFPFCVFGPNVGWPSPIPVVLSAVLLRFFLWLLYVSDAVAVLLLLKVTKNHRSSVIVTLAVITWCRRENNPLFTLYSSHPNTTCSLAAPRPDIGCPLWFYIRIYADSSSIVVSISVCHQFVGHELFLLF